MNGGLQHLRARRRLGRFGVGAALLSCATLVATLPARGAESLEAAQWLQRMRTAAADRNYHGTMMTSAGGVVSGSRVSHVCSGSDRFEYIESLDGQPRHQFRHNNLVLTKWPQAKVVVSEQQDVVTDFPSLPETSTRALENYELRAIGKDRVAGHEVEVLMLKPRDDLRYAQRLWAERDSGLLLRSDMLGPKGEVLESSTFTELTFGVRHSAEALLRKMKQVKGLRVVRSEVARTTLKDQGWLLQGRVPGFEVISCVRRPLDAVAEGGAADTALQTVFSDGMSHVSLFIERYDARRHKPMRTALGATNTLMNRQGDWWITIVGDVPMATVRQFEALLQRKP